MSEQFLFIYLFYRFSFMAPTWLQHASSEEKEEEEEEEEENHKFWLMDSGMAMGRIWIRYIYTLLEKFAHWYPNINTH